MMRDPFDRKHAVVHYKVNELPSRAAYRIPLKISRNEVALLCERLHSFVIDRKGASFYYPNDNRTQNHCRYEWHRRVGSDRFGLRIGVEFLVGIDGIDELEIYATTNDVIQDLATPAEVLNGKLCGIAYREAVETINRALEGLDDQKAWFCVFHVETPYGLGFSRRAVFEDDYLTVLPTRISKDFKRVSAVIVRAEGASSVSARDAAFAKLTTICALLTLSESQRYEVAQLNTNLSRPIAETVKSLKTVNEDRLYPIRRKWPSLEAVDDRVLDRFSWVLSAFHDLTPEATESFSGPLFAFYGATIRNSDLATLSAVGYMAALSALAAGRRTKCKGNLTCSLCGGLSWKHDIRGEVPAIVDLLRDLIGNSELGEIEAMLRRAHGSQRSSFVHGALHRHQEYRQGPQIPAALPTENAVVHQERLVYSEDLLSLSMLTRSALLHLLASLTGRELDRDLFAIRHLTRLSHYGHISLQRLVEARVINSAKRPE